MCDRVLDPSNVLPSCPGAGVMPYLGEEVSEEEIQALFFEVHARAP